EDGIRDWSVTGVQTCALPIWRAARTRNVERHHLALRQRGHERLDQFEARADAVEDDERRQMRGSRTDADAQSLAVDGLGSNVHRETCALPDHFNVRPTRARSSTRAHICPRRIGAGRVRLIAQALPSDPKLA